MPAIVDFLFTPFTTSYPRSVTILLTPTHLSATCTPPFQYFLQPFPKRPAFLYSSSAPPRTLFENNSFSIHRFGCSRSGIYLFTCAARPIGIRISRSQLRKESTTFRPRWKPRGKPYFTPQQSRLGGWTVILLFTILSSVFVLHWKSQRAVKGTSEDLVSRTQDWDGKQNILAAAREDWSRMSGDILAGRPGNLTLEQEEKLKEIWTATLQVFGVLGQHVKEANGSGPATPTTKSHLSSDAVMSEKPKKKRMSLFSRKHKDLDTESKASTDAISPGLSSDPDDKFGQAKQFHDTLAQQSPESLRAAFWSMVKHDHPDALLLRFLRARKWDVEKAVIMMVATMSWRATEMHVDDDIMRLGEEGSLVDSQSTNPVAKKQGEDFLAQMRMGKSFLHGTDRDGRPMCFVRVRLHKQGEQSEESLERYTVFVIETARMILAPPVDTACIVFDLTGFSLANMDYSPVKFMIKCFEANYPESLGVVLVHKAPWIFQGIWKIIKGWLDPVVASKVHFTNNVEELEEYVPKPKIPKGLGGEENWSYQYVEPATNENDKMKDTMTRDRILTEREKIVKEYEEVTLEWIGLDADTEGPTIKERRHNLAINLRDDYWKLDPYIRARSLYDRVDMIQPGGKIVFYPTAPVAMPMPITNGTYKTETSVDDID